MKGRSGKVMVREMADAIVDYVNGMTDELLVARIPPASRHRRGRLRSDQFSNVSQPERCCEASCRRQGSEEGRVMIRLIRGLCLFAFLCFLWAIAGTFVDEREAEEPPVRVEVELRRVENAIAEWELARARRRRETDPSRVHLREQRSAQPDPAPLRSFGGFYGDALRCGTVGRKAGGIAS